MTRTRLKYTKPVIVDLQDGGVQQATALCAGGNSDGGACWTGAKADTACFTGGKARLGCVSGGNAGGRICSGGTTVHP
jgi:hypothetical protein